MLFFKPSMDASLADNQQSNTQESASQDSSASSAQTDTNDSADDSNASSSASASASGSTSDSASDSALADGTYTGELISTNRGDVQVQITVSGGAISKATAITYPNETEQSRTISAQVIPTYEQEAVSSQSSDITLISGATETYTGFTGSLQDAINQAQEAGS